MEGVTDSDPRTFRPEDITSLVSLQNQIISDKYSSKPNTPSDSNSATATAPEIWTATSSKSDSRISNKKLSNHFMSQRKLWQPRASKYVGLDEPKSRRVIRSSQAANSSLFKAEEDSTFEMPTQTNKPAVQGIDSMVSKSLPRPPFPNISPDKALPPLPVAIVKPKSPIIRRSLIDATERPLRRSLSPKEGGTQDEEWPTLSPTTSSSASPVDSLPPESKSNVDDSLIDRIQKMTTDENKENVWVEASAFDDSSPNSNDHTTEENHDIQAIEESTLLSGASPSGLHDATTAQRVRGSTPLSSLSHTVSPQVRQTRTSELRLRLSADKINKLKTGTKNISMNSRHPLQVQGASRVRSGPVRHYSRLHHAATLRGSPYAISIRSKTRKGDSNLDENSNISNMKSYGEVMHLTSGTSELLSPPHAEPTCRSRTSMRSKPRSSLPVPSRMIQALKKDQVQNNQEVDTTFSGGQTITLQHESEDADIDTDSDVAITRPVSRENLEIVSDEANGNNSPSFEKLSLLSNHFDHCRTRTADNCESDHVHENQEGENTSNEFRVKRITQDLDGPILRIAKSADRLILGSDPDSEELQPDFDKSKQHKSSNLRHSVVLKEHLRRSRDLIQSPLQLTHSLTERSLSRFGRAASQESKKSLGGDTIIESCRDVNPKNEACESIAESSQGSDKHNSGWNQINKSKSYGDNWPLKDVEHTVTSKNEVQNPPGSDLLPTPPGSTSLCHDPKQLYPPRTSSKSPYGQNVTSIYHNPEHLPSASDNIMRHAIDGTSDQRDENITKLKPPKLISPNDQQIDDTQNLSGKTIAHHAEEHRNPGKKTVLTMRGLFNKHFKSNTTNNSPKGSIRGRQHRFTPNAPSPAAASPLSRETTKPLKHKTSTPKSKFNDSLSTDLNSPSRVETRPTTPATWETPRIPSATSTFITSAVEPLEIQEATRIALELLDKARDEPKLALKARLVDLSKLMIRLVTSARDAEKAREQANQAAAKAEIHCIQTKKAITEISELIAKFLENGN